MEEKYLRVKPEESNKVAKRLLIKISIIVISSILIKNILS